MAQIELIWLSEWKLRIVYEQHLQTMVTVVFCNYRNRRMDGYIQAVHYDSLDPICRLDCQ